jgi:hypothetical protein
MNVMSKRSQPKEEELQGVYKQLKILEMKSKATVTRKGKGDQEGTLEKKRPVITTPVDVDDDDNPNGQESLSSLHSSHHPGSKQSSKSGLVS